MTDDEPGGRVFFGPADRGPAEADEIDLLSVGIDIGSASTHLVLSRITMRRQGERFAVAARDVLHESAVTLTPYVGDDTIDEEALGSFLGTQYALGGIDPHDIDTGAVILTGTALERRNARAIAALFAEDTGRFVAVGAGDAMEAMLAAHGAGAAARSAEAGLPVMNVDIGGGTTKIALCRDGAVVDLTVLDVGARLVCLGGDGIVTRLAPAAQAWADRVGVPLSAGAAAAPEGLAALAEAMADAVLQAACGGAPASLRLPPLQRAERPAIVSFSGGVAEYIYGREGRSFGDLGKPLAAAVRRRFEGWGPRLELGAEGIRATVIGASQYTVQVSGDTILVSDPDLLPLRNLPVLALDQPLVDAPAVAAAVRQGLDRLGPPDGPVAHAYRWRGTASLARLDGFCRGVVEAVAPRLAAGQPLVLVGDADVGGLIGLQCRDLGVPSGVVSIDGIAVSAFDFIDIGTRLDGSGPVAVVVKSLLFRDRPIGCPPSTRSRCCAATVTSLKTATQ